MGASFDTKLSVQLSLLDEDLSRGTEKEQATPSTWDFQYT